MQPPRVIMNHIQYHTATVEEAATVEHVWNLITVAHAPEFYGISCCPRRRWIKWPEVILRQLGIADRQPARKSLPLFLCFSFLQQDTSTHAFLNPSHRLGDGPRRRLERGRILEKPSGHFIPPPGYVQDTQQAPGIGIVHHFIVACAPSPDLHVVDGVGRFSTDIHMAREDGAAALTKAMLGATQMNLSDYSTDLLRDVNAEISNLRRELEELNVKHATLKVKYMDLRGEFAPGAAPHSSDSDDN
ncbi:hypothetical protein PIB30_026453 [Stylosanthes scabra]|uniref:Uncharacterized protein n=1 Tax=Stylosanthes scabra TaxID=79078 RepID=A0ABU6V9C5_9FABA|nr:hypothetical protein [Stylosanthes scabra]